MDNWNWIEVVWTLVAAIGAYFSFNNIRDGLADLKVLRPRVGRSLERQILHVAAYGATRRDIFRFIIQVTFTGIGVLAGQIPSSPNPSILGQILGYIFVGISGLLTLSAYFDHHDRAVLRLLGAALLARAAKGQ